MLDYYLFYNCQQIVTVIPFSKMKNHAFSRTLSVQLRIKSKVIKEEINFRIT